MLYIQIKDGKPFHYPIVHENLLMLIPPGIIHPDRLPVPDDIFSLGFTIYVNNPPPVQTDPYTVVHELEPVLDENKYAQQTWAIRPMTDEEREIAIKIGKHKIKKRRFHIMEATQWVTDRHADEKYLGLPTSYTEEQITELVQYRQALRSMDYSDPLAPVWPPAPEFWTGRGYDQVLTEYTPG